MSVGDTLYVGRDGSLTPVQVSKIESLDMEGMYMGFMSQDQTQYVPLIRILSALSNVNSFRKQNKTKKQCMLYTALGYQNNFVTAVMLLSAFGLWWSRVMSQKLVNIGSGDGLYDCKCLTAPWSVIKWKHFPRYWLFVGEIHRPPVDSPHRDQ